VTEPAAPVEPVETPLLLIKGDATKEEVAALVAVLQGMATAASQETAVPAEPGSSWAAPVRRLRTTFPSGPGGWRASALPR
jgi:hypothetical protein